MKQVISILKSIGFEFVYGAHLLSLGGVGIILSILLVTNLEINFVFLLMIYLMYQVVYNYNHFRELKSDLLSNPERSKHLSTRQRWISISPFFYLVLLVGSLITTNIPTLLLVSFITIGGILYTEYFKKIRILGFKSYYVSFFWALSIMLIPLFYSQNNFTTYVYFAVFIFLRFMVSTIFFDIKDIDSDKRMNIITFPIKWGKKKTIYILHIINIASILPVLLGIYLEQLGIYSLLLASVLVIDFIYLAVSMNLKNKDLRILSYLVVDGQYMFWPLIIFILINLL